MKRESSAEWTGGSRRAQEVNRKSRSIERLFVAERLSLYRSACPRSNLRLAFMHRRRVEPSMRWTLDASNTGLGCARGGGAWRQRSPRGVG